MNGAAAREQCGIHQAGWRRAWAVVSIAVHVEKNAIRDPRASRIIGIAEALGVVLTIS